MKLLLSLLLLLSLSFNTQAIDVTHSLEEHTVHYNLFDSLSIPAEVAERLQLKRGDKLAYLNIAIIPKNGGFGIEVFRLFGKSRNMLQQHVDLEFIKIEEKDTTYYLVPVPFRNEEIMHFDISVQISSKDEPETFTFTRKLYKSHI